eukprot:TRINITY_DN4441_c0_g1_i5.p1 TRINITY_DN4441_c0_g1~~TRINITY_DN4441_c0_g1_i5.p1  ORF type:complete len:156 (-),score=45.07 TRINITY_DN4441_c0_g1_i5:53-520(-)
MGSSGINRVHGEDNTQTRIKKHTHQQKKAQDSDNNSEASEQQAQNDSDQEFVEEQPKSKRGQKINEKEKSKNKGKSSSDDKDVIVSQDEVIFELGAKKRVTVRRYKGKILVDFREFWEKGGELNPTKKGVALTLESWEKFKKHVKRIDEAIVDLK